MLSPLNAIERDLATSGLSVTHLSAQDLSEPPTCDVLLYPAGKRYPAGAEKSIDAYLRKGGKLIVLGGPAFTEPAWKAGDTWRTWAELREDLSKRSPDHPLFDFERPDDANGWLRATNDTKSPGSVATGDFGGGHGKCLQIDIAKLSGWDNWSHAVSGLPAGRNLMTFRARGDAHTGYLSIELAERDGSRWIAAIPITPQWAFYALGAADFKYWHDSASKGRGGTGDRVRLENVSRIAPGLAFSHTPVEPGPHRLWIDDIAVQQDPRPQASESSQLVLDGLSPEYKYFPVHGAARATGSGKQRFVEDCGYPLPARPVSVSPRPQGDGFDKGRRFRYVPLIEARGAGDRKSGDLAWLVLNGAGSYAGSAWAVFGVNEPEFYKDEHTRKAVVRLASALCGQPYLFEGGAEYNAYFHDETSVTLGARVVLPEVISGGQPHVRITVDQVGGGKTLYQWSHTWTAPFSGPNDERWNGARVATLSTVWRPEKSVLALGRFIVTTQIIRDGHPLDDVSHELFVWNPKPPNKRSFVSVHDGHFQLNGKSWSPHGVNYMPSSGIALEDDNAFEQWLSSRAYDPDVVENDLSRIAALGMNSISVFVYHDAIRSRNLLDLLMRAERHGLKVNLSLRPHADPFDYDRREVEDMIRTARLAENDTVFAYDLAWERGFGNYEPSYYNVKGRKGYDADWKAWVTEQYGSVASAEADWGMPIPRRNGEVTGPSDSQLDQDGPWRKLVAAYRRFVDDLTSHTYGRAARHIRSIDPNHLISFRMTIAGDPTAPPREFPFDFRGLGRALDMMEPEGYGRLGDWPRVREGAFTAAYSRYAAPGRPVYWAEFGRSAWAGTNFLEKNTALDAEGSFYDDFYRMLALSRSDGSSAWWYPGGYRKNEESDYGIINPDGSDRATTTVIRRRIPDLLRLAEQPQPPVDTWIEVDRDADARGLGGIYEKAKTEFWQAVDAGRHPGLRDAGTGTTSVNTPVLAVGNVPYTSNNPPKYLNAEFDRLEVQDASGRWVEVTAGPFRAAAVTVEVAAGRPVMLRASVGNTHDARWIAPAGEKPPSMGTVLLTTTPESEIQMARPIPIPHDVPSLGTAEIANFALASSIEKESGVELRMTAWKRMWFGEKVRFHLKPVR